MDKKTLAYILIAGGAAVALYYFFFKKSAASKLGAGKPDTRGAWAADDDRVYNSMRNKVKAFKGLYDGEQALGWIDPIVEEWYNGNNYFHKLRIQGQERETKAGAFLSVFEGVNVNVEGKYFGNPPNQNQAQLFPESLHDTLWKEFNAFKVKYGGL